jgi:hypothetical protein
MDAMLKVDAAQYIAALPYLRVLCQWGGASSEFNRMLRRTRPDVIIEGPVSGPAIENGSGAIRHRSLPTCTDFRARR